MEQFRLVLGLGLVAIQLGVAALMAVLFLKTRGEQASRYWAIATIVLLVSMLLSGFLPFGKPPLWQLFLSALLTVASHWLVWRGFRSYRGMSAPWWGWALPTGFIVLLWVFQLLSVPQIFRSLAFTFSSCSVLVLVTYEALASRESRARWLVVFAALTNIASFLARPALLLLGYDVGANTETLPSLLATYLVPVVDFFLLFAGLTLLAIHRLLIQKDALATLDELTQLPNRRALVESAARAVRLSCRTGEPFGLMLVDVDHFKNVNDGFGHSTGDDVLREVSRVLVSGCRPTDLVSRYGGDEFVILLPGLGSQQALLLAQRLAQAVRSDAVAGAAITVSVGVAAFEGCDEAQGWEPVFERADRALYSAKENGRDRVAVG